MQDGRIKGRHGISREVDGLDPGADSARIVYLGTNRLLPRIGRRFVFNLLYTLGFLRISGAPAGALPVDRIAKVHRAPDRRAGETIEHFTLWLQSGAESEPGMRSLADVRRIHDQVARRYPLPNDALLHGTCLFAIQFQDLLHLIGARGFTRREQEAQAIQWRAIGESLGATGVPDDWDGMSAYVRTYEASPVHYGPSEEGQRCAESLITQFQRRWLPPGLRWSGRLIILSLLEDHVLHALSLRKPPRLLAGTVRLAARTGMAAERRLLGEPRHLLDLAALGRSID